jgi:dienelactone hydrolase
MSARLRTPDAHERSAAVIIFQGSEGHSERGRAYADALHDAGFVTLQLDRRNPHAAAESLQDRLEVYDLLSDAFGALRFLAGLPEVDERQVGLLGLSSGADAALLAATTFVNQQYGGGDRFSAILALCPTCHLFNHVRGYEFSGLTWAPVLIATAALDEFDNDADAGPALARALSALDRAKVRTAVFYGAHHDFDVPGPRRTIEHPQASRGAGGLVTLAYDPVAAARAHLLAVQFFSEMKQQPGGRQRPSPAALARDVR